MSRTRLTSRQTYATHMSSYAHYLSSDIGRQAALNADEHKLAAVQPHTDVKTWKTPVLNLVFIAVDADDARTRAQRAASRLRVAQQRGA